MKLSKETIAALKCMSTVNPNILLKPGKVLSSISPLKNVMAEMQVAEEFHMEFGIYDLSEFLGVLSIFEDSDVIFDEKVATIAQGKAKIKYFAADPSILVVPTRQLKFPSSEVDFKLEASVLAMAQKTAGILKSSDVSFVGDGSELSLVVQDLKNPSANNYSVVIGETDLTFRANLKVENLKMPSDDYEVSLTSKKISRFKNVSGTSLFYIALEATSQF